MLKIGSSGVVVMTGTILLLKKSLDKAVVKSIVLELGIDPFL